MSTIKLKPFSSNPEEVYRIELLAEKLNAALVKVFRHRKVCSSVKAYNVEDLAKGLIPTDITFTTKAGWQKNLSGEVFIGFVQCNGSTDFQAVSAIDVKEKDDGAISFSIVTDYEYNPKTKVLSSS